MDTTSFTETNDWLVPTQSKNHLNRCFWGDGHFISDSSANTNPFNGLRCGFLRHNGFSSQRKGSPYLITTTSSLKSSCVTHFTFNFFRFSIFKAFSFLSGNTKGQRIGVFYGLVVFPAEVFIVVH